MKVEQLITLTERRIASLHAARTTAESVGDVDAIIRADTEIAEAQTTLDKLRNIPAN